MWSTFGRKVENSIMIYILLLVCPHNSYLFLIEVSTFVNCLLSFLIRIFPLFFFYSFISIVMGHAMRVLIAVVTSVFALLFALSLCGISEGLHHTVASFSR